MRSPEYCRTTCADYRTEICPLGSLLERLVESALDAVVNIPLDDVALTAGSAIHSDAYALMQNDKIAREEVPSRSAERSEKVKDCIEMHASIRPLAQIKV